MQFARKVMQLFHHRYFFRTWMCNDYDKHIWANVSSKKIKILLKSLPFNGGTLDIKINEILS